jgi:hypothetical protein
VRRCRHRAVLLPSLFLSRALLFLLGFVRQQRRRRARRQLLLLRQPRFRRRRLLQVHIFLFLFSSFVCPC